MFLNFFKFIFFIFANISFAQDFTPKETNVSVSIIPSNGVIIVEDDFYFGIKFDLKDGWKTYWKNPGDAGAALSIEWEDASFENDLNLLFPFPKKFIEKGITTIGYEDEVIFPVKIERDGLNYIKKNINLNYLICKDICIPVSETRLLSINFKNRIQSESFTKNYKTVSLTNQNHFIIDSKIISNEKIQIKVDNRKKIKDLDLFAHSEEVDIRVEKTNSLFEIYLDNDNNLLKKPINIYISDGKNFEKISFYLDNKKQVKSIIHFIFLAFIGGIILNLMPCVLPVISLKLYSFLSMLEENKNNIRKNCLLIVAGIITSFIILASSVIILKIFGQIVGWGFQFQNKFFLIFILIIILLFSLNLLGFFEVLLPQSFLNWINNLISSKSGSSQFLSGVFATLLATPCSAPFLGTAVGFSMGSSNINILIIFFSISLGFAFPYLIFIIIPKIIMVFPKPGKWMENFKYFLGLLLFSSFIWLVNLFKVNQMIILISIFIIIYFSYIKLKNKFTLISSLVFLILNILIFSDEFSSKKKTLVWENYDQETLKDYLKNDRTILIDVTAEWCVTCKFNKLTTLNTNSFIDFINEKNIVTIQADWTERDKDILDFIKNYNKYGIPVNIVYGPKNKEGILLPEIISKDIVINQLLKAGLNEN